MYVQRREYCCGWICEPPPVGPAQRFLSVQETPVEPGLEVRKSSISPVVQCSPQTPSLHTLHAHKRTYAHACTHIYAQPCTYILTHKHTEPHTDWESCDRIEILSCKPTLSSSPLHAIKIGESIIYSNTRKIEIVQKIALHKKIFHQDKKAQINKCLYWRSMCYLQRVQLSYSQDTESHHFTVSYFSKQLCGHLLFLINFRRGGRKTKKL